MGVHLLAFVAARGFLQVFQVSAPLLWPLNLWMPLARHLPEACAAFYDAAVSHAARLRDAVARSRRRDGTGGAGVLDDYLRYALMSFSD